MASFAFVFPGQGSQSVGMLNGWGEHPAVRDTLAEASAALGQDLGALMRDGPQDDLDLTTNTQPVMLCRHRLLPRLARAKAAPSRPRWPAIRWANTARWSPPAC